MLNTNQRVTNAGRPVVDKIFGTPLFNLPVHIRLKNARKALGLGINKTTDEIWDAIQYDVRRLKCA